MPVMSDSLGEVFVKDGALYGAQTQRAIDNFKISNLQMPKNFINAVLYIKEAAAIVNYNSNKLAFEKSQSIQKSCQELRNGDYSNQFPLDVFQTGSGTSTNMNVNEVISGFAKEKFGITLDPNDDVNMSQSSNDTIPTAITVSSLLLVKRDLMPKLEKLIKVCKTKEKELKGCVKTGRTHLMDAMPIDFSQEISGWRFQFEENLQRIQNCIPRFCKLAQGGTAVGTGINTPKHFAKEIAKTISEITGVSFEPSQNHFALISGQENSLELSSCLKNTASTLMKVSNDLRIMNSGPLSGFNEIELQALQPGSSIMPGKVNPVIPEAVCMACAQVIGNDTCITIGAQSGLFQLNVMLPVIAYNLLQSISLVANSAEHLAEKAIATFKVREDNIQKTVSRNPILATALNEHIGYKKAAEIAKKAYKENKSILEVALAETDIKETELKEILDPNKLICKSLD
ncbi:fumarase class II [Allofrancisella inopinata]|uniref:fumarate hydratase n=1 Tax=Allofrancisella inopinata TaxID=1085647 RepID=A0AAE6YJI0_9GAMM|nr:class II fumarate hydratase [Allofrancisella inopinata]QIV95934.1 class II fumarate hydratase [Allofrancisella inopinata]TDT74353.1 fumarase class II [Allofrancisella inopinata]